MSVKEIAHRTFSDYYLSKELSALQRHTVPIYANFRIISRD